METAQMVYAKLQKAGFTIWGVLLGGGALMAIIATYTHDVILWAYGIEAAMTSIVFFVLAQIATKKLKQFGV